MKIIIVITAILICNMPQFVYAQGSIGLSFNSVYIGRNIGLSYQYNYKQAYQIGVGLKYHINTEIRKYDYLGVYKRGYAKNFREGLGIVFIIKRKIDARFFKNKNYLSLNTQYSQLGSRTQSFKPIDTLNIFVPQILNYKVMNVIESNVCLNLEFPISNKFSFTVESGIGLASFFNIDSQLQKNNKNYLFRFAYLFSITINRSFTSLSKNE